MCILLYLVMMEQRIVRGHRKDKGLEERALKRPPQLVGIIVEGLPAEPGRMSMVFKSYIIMILYVQLFFYDSWLDLNYMSY
jgi:hypothetical protein